MPRRSEVVLAVAALAFFQGCGSCAGEATPEKTGSTSSSATVNPNPKLRGHKLLSTGAIPENKPPFPDAALVPE